MLGKIGDVFKVKEVVDSINEELGKTKDELDSFRKKISEIIDLQKEFSEIKQQQKSMISSIKESSDAIRMLKDDLKKEVYDFKLIRNQTQKNIMQKFEEELSKELASGTDALKSDLQEYSELKLKMNSMINNMTKLEDDINNLRQIASSIKKEDFDLSKHMKGMKEAESEKLELMRKIDGLERLCASLRRRMK